MNTIQKELKLSETKMFEELPTPVGSVTLVKLSRDNVAMAEAMIRNDSAYIRSNNTANGPVKRDDNYHGGSTAFWMTKLKEVIVENKITEYTYEAIIQGAVEAVDRENSTHLNADTRGREEITKRICGFSHEELIKCLQDPDYKDMLLFNEIARITSAEKRARRNLSFASKFCHFACFYVFNDEDSEYQDNYSIYDSVLKKVIPLYLKYYNLDVTRDLNNYKHYRTAIDDIRNACGEEISRNGFDQLLWYYFKGRV